VRHRHVSGELRYRTRKGRFFLLWSAAGRGEAEDGRVSLECVTDEEDGLFVTIKAHDDILVEGLEFRWDEPSLERDRFFLNGYQSWTDSREFSADERITPFPTLLRPVLERFFRTNHYGDYDLIQPDGGHNLRGFTYFYFRDERDGRLHFLGSLSEREGFTIFRVVPEKRRVVVQKDCEGKALRRGDTWRAFQLHAAVGEQEEVFDGYLRRFYKTNHLVPRVVKSATGWTSWYYHYTNISETISLKNLEALRRRNVPIDIFQIDDGWQGAVGDWLTVNEKFPHGLGWLTDRIHAEGYRAGLWLAPFVAEKKSRLVREHPEWVLRDEDGAPIPAGNSALWSGDFYGLDIGHTSLRRYLKEVFDTILGAWGFDLVKLDFLYGACLVPRNGKTRGELMTEGMEFLRELVGDKQILGCGVPLGPSFGRVDYCRIGPDVGHEWRNTLTRGLGMRETISTVTALENAIGRHKLSGRAFLNDPDVFFLRPLSFEKETFNPFIAAQELRWGKRKPLSDDEKYTLFLLNNLFGRLVFTSDDIDEYPAKEMSLYLSSFPLKDKEDVHVSLAGPRPAFGEIGGCYEVRFRIGALGYLVLANLSDEGVRRTLPKAGFSRDGHGAGRLHSAGETISLGPHASFCQLEDGGGALLGTESSLFPGSDIDDIRPDGEGGLLLRRNPRALGVGLVFLRVPEGAPGLRINGTFVPATRRLGQTNVVAFSADKPLGDASAVPPLMPGKGML